MTNWTGLAIKTHLEEQRKKPLEKTVCGNPNQYCNEDGHCTYETQTGHSAKGCPHFLNQSDSVYDGCDFL